MESKLTGELVKRELELWQVGVLQGASLDCFCQLMHTGVTVGVPTAHPQSRPVESFSLILLRQWAWTQASPLLHVAGCLPIFLAWVSARTFWSTWKRGRRFPRLHKLVGWGFWSTWPFLLMKTLSQRNTGEMPNALQLGLERSQIEDPGLDHSFSMMLWFVYPVFNTSKPLTHDNLVFKATDEAEKLILKAETRQERLRWRRETRKFGTNYWKQFAFTKECWLWVTQRKSRLGQQKSERNIQSLLYDIILKRSSVTSLLGCHRHHGTVRLMKALKKYWKKL